MTATHQAILAELYEIDPELREHEAELVPLLQKLLERDPARKPDAAFVKRLRKELQERVNAVADGAIEHRISYAPPSGFFHRFAYALAGAAAAIVIAVPITLDYSKRHSPMPPASPETGDESPVAKSDGYAIADQSAGMPSPGRVGNDPVAGMGYARTQSGGGGDMAMGTMSAVSSLIAPWNPVKYRIEGDLPTLPSGTVDVHERTTSSRTIPFSSIAGSFDIDDVDLSSFGNATVDMVTFSQNQPYGYSVSLSMTDGSASINQQWDQWPHPGDGCIDEACARKHQIKASDIPSDAELARIADDFFKRHGIDRSGYGNAVVEDTWQTSYAATDGENPWVPDSITVVYPLLIDGKTAMESYGGHAGVSVAVSVREKKVSSVWGLTQSSFKAEKHPAVSDRADIEEFISLTGSETPDAPTATLKDPTIGYVRLPSYENNVAKDLFVPAIIFRVSAPEGSPYVPRTIAVPLAKDYLDEAKNDVPRMNDPVPMPLEGGPAVDVPAQEEPIPPEPLMMEKPAR